ncbi:LacI family DNA-binding transcriptional regulator, partial [Enterovibrio norvegicus]
MKKVTITDVAEHAGVSVTTVSMVLGNKGRISADTIEKVNNAVAAIGYVRNRA